MRRYFWAAMIGVCLGPIAAEAGNRDRYDYTYNPLGGNRLYGAPAGGVSPNYSTYGRRLRGGFGRNGFAPTFGPVCGPNAFVPATGVAPIGGPYARPSIHPQLMLGGGHEADYPPAVPTIPSGAVVPADSALLPPTPVTAPALK